MRKGPQQLESLRHICQAQEGACQQLSETFPNSPTLHPLMVSLASLGSEHRGPGEIWRDSLQRAGYGSLPE